MNTPSLNDRFVVLRAGLTDQEFGHTHWRGAQFSSPWRDRLGVMVVCRPDEDADLLRAKLEAFLSERSEDPSPSPSSIPATAGGTCMDCGCVMDPGEAKVFTCCTPCWDRHYAKYRAAASSGERGAVVDELTREAQRLGLGYPSSGERVTDGEVEDALRAFYTGDEERLAWDDWRGGDIHRDVLRRAMREALEDFIARRKSSGRAPCSAEDVSDLPFPDATGADPAAESDQLPPAIPSRRSCRGGQTTMAEYTCARCLGVFEAGWSEEEAEAEYRRDFPELAAANAPRDVICDECYKQFTGWKSDLSDEEKASLDAQALLDAARTLSVLASPSTTEKP